jgi:thiosulfate/3-mercaptopyruvate sulfurtransferase
MKALVSSVELMSHPLWRVLDCRYSLAEPESGRQRYNIGHIPGAVYAHLDEVLSGVGSGGSGRHPLPSVDVFAEWLGKCGLKPADTVVAYDDTDGIFAARAWWMLRWIGHRSAAILDGGMADWVSRGFVVDCDRPCFAPTIYAASPDSSLWVTVAEVEANLRNPRFQLLDARPANRFAGRDETLDPVGGHIPDAINRPYASNLVAGRFKSGAQLRQEFTELLGASLVGSVVHQCGSGVSACHNLLAMEVAGLRGSRLYPGSWSEWCSDPTRPIITTD